MFEWSYWGYGSALALIAWIPFSFWRFSRVRPALAAAQVVIWGMMWLPEGAAFDLPALPPFSKYTISAVCVLIGLLWKAPERLRAARVGRGYDLLILLMIIAQVGTVLTNPDALHYGTWKTIAIPGFTPYDGISAAVRVVLTVALPCVLGRALLRSDRDLHDLLETLAIAGVVYSLPILYEIRMSPVLHDMVYGYAPRSDWSQNLRAGGYRPTAFMGHGLVVGFFMFLCTTAAMTLQKAGQKRLLGQPIAYAVGYLCLILLLCKAAAPIIYAAVGFALLHYGSAKSQARVLTLLGLIVLSYPITRILDVFPVEGILSVAGALGPDRVQSLQFRFDNEDILLLKGAERLWFGWGGYGRERVFDAETAKDLVIQDGQWIVVFGQSGLLGFLCYFSVLLVPVWQLARGLKRVAGRSERSMLVGFGFCVVVCAVNMLPNMQLPYLQFLFASGLAVALGCMTRQGSRPAPARSLRPSQAASVRPSRSAPMRTVWYSTPPPDAYVSDLVPRAADDPRVRPVTGNHVVATPAPANDAREEQEQSVSVQTVVIRALTERPTMRPPAPAEGADLSSSDVAGSSLQPEPVSSQPMAADAACHSKIVPVSARVPAEAAALISDPPATQSGMTAAASGKVSERVQARVARAGAPLAGDARASQRPITAPPPASASKRPSTAVAASASQRPSGAAASASRAPGLAASGPASVSQRPSSGRAPARLGAPTVETARSVGEPAKTATSSASAAVEPSANSHSASPRALSRADSRGELAAEPPAKKTADDTVVAGAAGAPIDSALASFAAKRASAAPAVAKPAATGISASPDSKPMSTSPRAVSSAPSRPPAAAASPSAPPLSGAPPAFGAAPSMSESAQAVARAMAGFSSRPKPPPSAQPVAASAAQSVGPRGPTQMPSGALPAATPANDTGVRAASAAPAVAKDVVPAVGAPGPAHDVPAASESSESESNTRHSVPPPPPPKRAA